MNSYELSGICCRRTRGIFGVEVLTSLVKPWKGFLDMWHPLCWVVSKSEQLEENQQFIDV